MNPHKRTRQNPLAGEYKFPLYGPSKAQVDRWRKIMGLPDLPAEEEPVKKAGMSIRLNDICLVRYKKLKGGRLVIRNRKTLRGLVVNSSPSGELLARFRAKNGTGSLVGKIDRNAGTLSMNLESFVPAGYAKGRNFRVVGYNISANVTNLTGRRKPQA